MYTSKNNIPVVLYGLLLLKLLFIGVNYDKSCRLVFLKLGTQSLICIYLLYISKCTKLIINTYINTFFTQADFNCYGTRIANILVEHFLHLEMTEVNKVNVRYNKFVNQYKSCTEFNYKQFPTFPKNPSNFVRNIFSLY